jgi:lipopolysaccharide biosynthesis regulator YciM
MPEVGATPSEDLGDFVLFVSSGMHVKGEFHCAECGYGVTVYRELPRCPMCGGNEWEQSAWSPFGRARDRAEQAIEAASGPLL